MLRESSLNSLIALVFTFALTACGGGGGSSSPNNNASSPASSSLAQSSSLANSQASSESSPPVSSSSATTSSSSSAAACTDCEISLVDSFPNAIHILMLSEAGGSAYEACFAFNTDTSTTEFIDSILSDGGQYGNCPDEDYFARCNYVGEEFGNALIQFTDSYAGELDTSAIATCGLYQGIFFGPDGVEDTREDREPNGLHQGFVRPVYMNIESEGGELFACRQIETESYSSSQFENLLSSGIFFYGACPSRGYIGGCHSFADGSDIPMVTYWLDTLVGRVQESVCRGSSGTWQDL